MRDSKDRLGTASVTDQYISLLLLIVPDDIQKVVFNKLYTETDSNVLIGATGGMGKIVATELAILGAFRARPDTKV